MWLLQFFIEQSACYAESAIMRGESDEAYTHARYAASLALLKLPVRLVTPELVT